MPVKTFITFQKIYIQINAVLLNFLFICESWKKKCITVSTKILCSTTIFNIDNNQKCFLSRTSSYYNDFWSSCDTEDLSNDAENTALITAINYILIITFGIIFHNITIFTVFLLNKCSHGEQKSHSKIILTPNIWTMYLNVCIWGCFFKMITCLNIFCSVTFVHKSAFL